MKNIDCSELAGYILTRQVHQARNLVQSEHIWLRVAFFGESPDFQATFRDYLDNFYDVSQKRNLIDAEFFDGSDTVNFAKANLDPAVQGIICGENLADQLTLEKDINGVRRDSAFENGKKLAQRYLIAGFDLPDDFNIAEALSILHFDQLVAAALIDNLIRNCYENFAIHPGSKDF